jgi:hypothetical protein
LAAIGHTVGGYGWEEKRRCLMDGQLLGDNMKERSSDREIFQGHNGQWNGVKRRMEGKPVVVESRKLK